MATVVGIAVGVEEDTVCIFSATEDGESTGSNILVMDDGSIADTLLILFLLGDSITGVVMGISGTDVGDMVIGS